MIKALFLDIDDTLIARGEDLVPDSAMKAIDICRNKGIKIIVATGRGYYLMQPDIKDRVKADYLITVNGSCINATDGTMVKSFPMKEEDYLRLIDLCMKRDYVFGFKFDDSLQVYNHYEDFAGRYASGSILKEWISDNTATRDYHVTHGAPLGCFTYSPNCEMMEEQKNFPNLKFVTAQRKFGSSECFDAEVNKGKTIRWLCDMFGITLDECMAFGDSDNDLEMIRMCGIGVAMGNATEELKEASDYVTTGINEDGIWNALKHFELI